MIESNVPFLDFCLDIFEEPRLADNVIILMSDGPAHIRRGRRSPVSIPTNKPNRTPKRSNPKVSGGKSDWRRK